MNESAVITKQLLFSLITGDLYEIESDELKNMDRYQVPLIKRPSSSCKSCYGRMHEGFNTTIKIYMMCHKCAPKCINFKLMKSEDIQIETIKNA